MKISFTILICLLGMTSFPEAFAEKPCALCEKVRKHNEEHPENNYFWYDDYLKDHPQQDPQCTDNQDKESPSRF